MRTLLLSFLVPVLVAQVPASSPKPMEAVQRKTVVEALNQVLRARYVFPEVAEQVAKALADKVAKGGYDACTATDTFEKALHEDLRTLGKDGHFRVRYLPDFKPRPESNRPPTPEEFERGRRQVVRQGFGLARTEILPGNIGYLDVRAFPPAEAVAPAYAAALTLLSGTEALILDLRQNGGGSPEGVAQLLSHFFAEGDGRHLNSIYSRPTNATRDFWTNPSATPRYTKPVWVLTSAFTFSGGEECAYDFQTQKRATLVGETTGGGANPGDMHPLAQGFVAFVPSGQAINPITKTNWEHVGVKPDLPAPAPEALKVAHLEALKRVIEDEKEPARKSALERTRAMVEKGEAPPPRYTKPQ